jgi:hypothetical protein
MDETSRAVGQLEGRLDAFGEQIMLFQRAIQETVAGLAESQSKAISDLARSQADAIGELATKVEDVTKQQDRLRTTGAGVLVGLAMASGSAGAVLKDIAKGLLNG